eukprot:m51a1_g8136 hypothetical protein (882) ;mRNA; r:10821-13961
MQWPEGHWQSADYFSAPFDQSAHSARAGSSGGENAPPTPADGVFAAPHMTPAGMAPPMGTPHAGHAGAMHHGGGGITPMSLGPLSTPSLGRPLTPAMGSLVEEYPVALNPGAMYGQSALTPPNFEDLLRSPSFVKNEPPPPQVPLTMSAMASGASIGVDPSIAHATPINMTMAPAHQIVPPQPLQADEEEFPPAAPQRSGAPGAGGPQGYDYEEQPAPNAGEGGAEEDEAGGDEGAAEDDGDYEEQQNKAASRPPRSTGRRASSGPQVNMRLTKQIANRAARNSPAGAGIPRSVIPSVATLELSSYKLCKYRKYEVRMSIQRTWRQDNGLSEIDILQALIGSKCCKLGTSQPVSCDRCACDQVVTLSATTQWPVRRDGSETETYLCAIQSKCTSSRDHLRSSLVLLIDNLPFPVPLTTEPFVLLARDKSGMRARGSGGPRGEYDDASPQEPPPGGVRGGPGAAAAQQKAARRSRAAGEHKEHRDEQTSRNRRRTGLEDASVVAPPPAQMSDESPAAPSASAAAVAPLLPPLPGGAQQLQQLQQLQQQQQQQQPGTAGSSPSSTIVSPSGMSLKCRQPVVTGPAIKFGVDLTTLLPEASVATALKREKEEPGSAPGAGAPGGGQQGATGTPNQSVQIKQSPSVQPLNAPVGGCTDPTDWGSGMPSSCQEFVTCASAAVPQIARALIQSEGLRAFLKEGQVSQEQLQEAREHSLEASQEGCSATPAAPAPDPTSAACAAAAAAGLGEIFGGPPAGSAAPTPQQGIFGLVPGQQQQQQADGGQPVPTVVVRLLQLKCGTDAQERIVGESRSLLQGMPGFVKQCHHDLGSGLYVTISTYCSAQDVATCDSVLGQFLRNKLPGRPNPLATDLISSGLMAVMAECRN